MRRFAWFTALIAMLALASSAAATPVLNTKLLSEEQCTKLGGGGRLVVNVTFILQNYADSGYAGAWALDTVHRHLKIWKSQSGTYCAHVNDDGSSFVTLDGPGPAGGGHVIGGITGTFDGGYITTDISGKFVPRYPTHGNLGTFNAKCDREYNCPGKRPSWLSYFSKNPPANDFAEWGWLYDAGAKGIWLDQANTSALRTGNITY
ncbi:MAG: hypothetical protein WCH31_05280 [Actinomycetes bacterium]